MSTILRIISEYYEPLATLFFVFLLVFLSTRRSAKKKRSAQIPGKNGTDSKSYTAKQLRKESSELSGKVHDAGHTHDRLDTDCVVLHETPEEHYRRQLDSFLKAGLIDKSEYTELYVRWNIKK